MVQAFLKKWWVESDFKAPNLPLSLRLKVSGCHYNSIYISIFLFLSILLASCYRFSCYYRFSDIAINSVNPSFIWRLEFSKNGLLNISLYIRLFLKPFLYFNILSIIWQLLLSVKWRHLFSCEVKQGRYTGWKRIYNPEMAGFKISWFWPSTKSYYI